MRNRHESLLYTLFIGLAAVAAVHGYRSTVPTGKSSATFSSDSSSSTSTVLDDPRHGNPRCVPGNGCSDFCYGAAHMLDTGAQSDPASGDNDSPEGEWSDNVSDFGLSSDDHTGDLPPTNEFCNSGTDINTQPHGGPPGGQDPNNVGVFNDFDGMGPRCGGGCGEEGN